MKALVAQTSCLWGRQASCLAKRKNQARRPIARQARCFCHFLGTCRAFAVVFFSLCALVHNAIKIPLVKPKERAHARAAWLHRWSRFACRVLGIRATTRGSMPSSGLLVSNHLSYLDIIVLSSIRPCVFVAKRGCREVAAIRLAGACCRDDLCRSRAETFESEGREWCSGRDRRRLGLVLFPEGTSSDGSTVLPFKSALLESAVQLRSSIAVASIEYALDYGSVADEVCYWRDMTLVPHLLNLLFKPEIRANYSFLSVKIRAGNRKEIACELRDEIVSIRS